MLDKPGTGNHKAFVDAAVERWRFHRDQRLDIVRDSLEMWDLYLTKTREFRQKGEEWRANMGLPDAFANVEAKVANLVSIMLSADPVVQPEGVHDMFRESAGSVEKLLDYAFRKNQFSKWLVKLCRQRSVVGTAFFKLTWGKQEHTFTFSRDPKAVARFQKVLDDILMNAPGVPPPPGHIVPQPTLNAMGLPVPPEPPPPYTGWMVDPVRFEEWRKMVNLAGAAKVPAPPLDGPQQVVQYRGPKLHLLPHTSVYLDALNDDMATQNFVVYRAVKPVDWLEREVVEGRYDAAAVDYAMSGWDGMVREQEENDLAAKMGIVSSSDAAADPYYRKAVELLEVWQAGAEMPYALILNQKSVINLKPEEMPFLHGECAIGAARATVVPGHFYGLSDLKPARDLFWEKRKLRNLRVDAVTLNVLPAFTKLREVGLPEMMHKVRPGALIPVSRADAIKSLVRDPLPGEAYQEPRELDTDIADAMGVYASTKGAPAQIGRVTGTEFQGRENRAQIRFKLDSIFLEEDLSPINRQMVALFAQFSDDPLRVKIGGLPDPFLTIDRTELIEALEIQWRFRGPNKAINRDMQVQQLLMWTKTFGQVLTPAEMRLAARLVLDLEDIRGASELVSDEGTQQKTQEYQAQAAAAQAQQQAQTGQANAAQEQAPAQAGPDEQAAMQRGGGGE
jgi:hypothetical protein